MSEKRGFSSGIGKWVGTAEVYSGEGRFLGNGADSRTVQDLGNGRVRIDVSFIGPFKAAGHYFIQDHGDHRLYQGPINVGYAETLGEGLVDANAYWASVGLTQRFFLMVLPDKQTQLSLALMSRGEQLIYTVVGQNDRVPDEGASVPSSLVNGTSYDFQHDPTAGRGELFLHRTGRWSGELAVLDGAKSLQGTASYSETIQNGDTLKVIVEGGGYSLEKRAYSLQTNGYQAWTAPGEVVGSYNLCGGRALSGTFHYLDDQLRLWRREVVAHDGTKKAVVHIWFRGGERIGIQYGLLNFEE
ncbi:MAG: hypothetical protein RLP44_30460 [Aggregatilineales bacterium]